MAISVKGIDWRAPSEGSAIAVTFTSLEVASARRWLRPMRPAPARPSLKGPRGSEPSGGEVGAVGALVGRRAAIDFGQHVLLDHDPARVKVPDLSKHRLDIEVAFAQPGKRMPAPDLGHGSRFAHYAFDHRATRVLQVKVVDPRPPVTERTHRITTAQQQVSCIEAEADRGQLENLLDLPGRLDTSARF